MFLLCVFNRNIKAHWKLAPRKLAGDEHYNDEHDMISSVPDIFTQRLTDQDEFIVVACDGVWDVLQNQEVPASNFNLFSTDQTSKFRLS